jgi:hypothetical protein
MNTKAFLVSRATNNLAWVGAIGLLLEIFLHKDHSVLMLVFFAALIFYPENYFRELFQDWAKKLKLNESEK